MLISLFLEAEYWKEKEEAGDWSTPLTLRKARNLDVVTVDSVLKPTVIKL